MAVIEFEEVSQGLALLSAPTHEKQEYLWTHLS
jgi:hypothetical protein